MSELRLLIVEDNVDELETCRRTIRRHSVEIGREVELGAVDIQVFGHFSIKDWL